MWKVIGCARKSGQVKIKRKPFEMSFVSAFCQVEKMQIITEY
jgi:ubiquitin